MLCSVTSPGVGRQAGARASLVSAWAKMAAMSWLKVRESKSRCAASLSSRRGRPSETVLSSWMSSRWPPHTASSVSRVCSQSEVSFVCGPMRGHLVPEAVGRGHQNTHSGLRAVLQQRGAAPVTMKVIMRSLGGH